MEQSGRLRPPRRTTAGVVLVFTILILLSNEDLRDRLVRLVGRQDLHRYHSRDERRRQETMRYFLFQLGLNSSSGILIGSCLWWAGLPNPILWGIFAALMRFVPFIGIFIALLPPLVLAVAIVPSWTLAITVLALFIGTEMVIGQVVEPLIYGHSTGLSPIAVIVATAFGAFLWGPVGLLLATPLTVCLIVIGRHVQPLAFFDVILLRLDVTIGCQNALYRWECHSKAPVAGLWSLQLSLLNGVQHRLRVRRDRHCNCLFVYAVRQHWAVPTHLLQEEYDFRGFLLA
jgi:hypothetical protein